MKIAITGGTGFVGRYIIRRLASSGHTLRCWYRPTSDRFGLEDVAAAVEWLQGELNDEDGSTSLVAGCDAVVHAALFRPGTGFRGAEGDLVEFVERNVIGTLQLVDAVHGPSPGGGRNRKKGGTRMQMSRELYFPDCKPRIDLLEAVETIHSIDQRPQSLGYYFRFSKNSTPRFPRSLSRRAGRRRCPSESAISVSPIARPVRPLA